LIVKSVGKVLKDHPLCPLISLYTPIHDPTHASTAGRDFTRNQIWRNTHLSTQVNEIKVYPMEMYIELYL